MITKKQYIEYLLSTPINYTCSNLSEHLENVSHDTVTDFLQNSKFTPGDLWDLVKERIDDSEEAFLLVDDSVQNKQYSHRIEAVKLQYSGNEHGLVKGIGLVNLVHSNGALGDFYPVNYRVYDPEADGKTKNEHFREMFLQAHLSQQIKARKIVFDAWYASVDNLKLIDRSGWTFYTNLKSNRKVSITKEVGYQHLEEIEWTAETLISGQLVRLKEVPFWLKLFKLVDTDGNIEWVITNNLAEDFTRLRSIEAMQVRWQVEEFHRSFKQLTGSEKCQCRKARSQRNHLACCYAAWVALKVKAQEVKKTVYQLRNGLFAEYLKSQLRNPTIPAL
ncbi:MAG: transposase [Acidobacteria bacterium]|nr:transposase [Acidobacteriota bacterium]MCA1640337.1 transposase [Acidobacteriota bacterium]